MSRALKLCCWDWSGLKTLRSLRFLAIFARTLLLVGDDVAKSLVSRKGAKSSPRPQSEVSQANTDTHGISNTTLRHHYPVNPTNNQVSEGDRS